MTNAEKIANYVLLHGTNSVLIHTIPNTSYWLICEKTKENPSVWRIILCDPDKKTWRLISNNMSDENHTQLWVELIKIQLVNNLKHNINILKTQAETLLI